MPTIESVTIEVDWYWLVIQAAVALVAAMALVTIVAWAVRRQRRSR
jgi:hypothetical protein